MKNVFLSIILLLCCSNTVIANPDSSEKETGANIIITSSKIAESELEVASSVTVINQEKIDNSGYNNIADLLRTIGSIGVSNAGGEGQPTSLRIRGEEGYRTLVMIDGVDIADPTGTQVTPQIQHLLLNNDVEKIEILRGSQGFIYGADAGGIVNIFTPKGRSPSKVNAKVEAGSFGAKRINGNVSGLVGKIDYFMSLSNNESDGFNAKKSDESRDDDGYENRTFHTKLGVNVNELNRFQIVLRDVESESEFDGCFLGFNETNECESNYEQTTTKLSYDLTLDNISQHIAYANSDINRESIAATEATFLTEGDLSRLEYWGNISKDTIEFIYGVDLEEENVEPNSAEKLNREQLGLYAEVKAQLVDKLILSAGVRQDDNDDFGKYLSERLSFVYLERLNNASIKLRASYGTGFRAPSLSEIAYNNSSAAFGEAANTQLKEEYSEGYDLGLDLIFDNGYIFKATLFDQVIEDEIFFDLSGFSGYLQASGDTQSKGLELSADLPISQLLNIYSNYTYNDTQDRVGKQRIRRPKHLANIGLQYFSADNKFTALTNIRMSKDAVDEYFDSSLFTSVRADLEDYVVVDFNAIYDVTSSLALFANIKNVLDEEYEEITGFNTAERSITAGFRYRF